MVFVDDFGIIINKNCTITSIAEKLKTNLNGTQIRNSTSVGDALADFVAVGFVVLLFSLLLMWTKAQFKFLGFQTMKSLHLKRFVNELEIVQQLFVHL